MPPLELKQLQSQFLSYVFNENSDILHEIKPSKGMTASDRLRIYQNAYITRIAKSLRDDFPILFQMLGESAFESLISDYLKSYPSRHYSLLFVGENLSTFIREKDPSFSAIADCVKLEWNICKTRFTPALPTVTLADTAYQWVVNPSCVLEKTAFSVLLVLEAFYETGKIIDIVQLIEPEYYLIWPSESGVQWCRLDSQTKNLFEMLMTYGSVNAITKMGDSENFTSDELMWMVKTLRDWVQRGLIIITKNGE